MQENTKKFTEKQKMYRKNYGSALRRGIRGKKSRRAAPEPRDPAAMERKAAADPEQMPEKMRKWIGAPKKERE